VDVQELIKQHMSKAYSLAYGMAGNQGEAEDVVQECALKVILKASLYDETLPFWPWFARIIRNTILDRFRREAKMSSLDENSGQLTMKEPGLDAIVEIAQTQESLNASLAKLDAQSRMVVVLVDIQGHSYQEAAQILSCPISTVGVWLHRARKELKFHLVADGVEL